MGAAALVLAARAGSTTPLLTAPRYLAIHLLVATSAAARGLHLLPGLAAMPLLAPSLAAAVGESAWPLLTAGSAVLSGGATGAWLSPPRPHLALALTLTPAIHLAALSVAHLSIFLLEAPRAPLTLAATALAVVWGAVVGVAGVWAAWAADRNDCPPVTGVGGERCHDCGHPRGPAGLLLWAGLGQVGGAGARVWMVAAPPASGWAWWGSLALPHALDLVVGVALLGAAARTLPSPTPRICWWQKRAAEVAPSALKVVQPLGVYTVTPTTASCQPKPHHARTLGSLSATGGPRGPRGPKSLDYVTSDFQLVWSNVRPYGSGTTHGEVDHRTLRDDVVPLTPGMMAPEVFTCTLPSYKLYAAPGTYQMGDVPQGTMPYPERYAATMSRGSGRGSCSPQITLRTSRSWDQLSTSHIYEEPAMSSQAQTQPLSDPPSPVSPALSHSTPREPPSTTTLSSHQQQQSTTNSTHNHNHLASSPTLTPHHLPHPARRPLAHHHNSLH